MKHLKYYKPFILTESSKSESATQSQKEPIKTQRTTKPSIVIDGTSSAGKSTMTEVLKNSGWITICGDDFFNDIDLRIQYDHGGTGKDLEAGDEFHEQMKEVRKNDEKHFQERGGTWVEYKKNPKNKEFKSYKLNSGITWYIYQDYLYGRGAEPGVKGVIFDVIDDDILKCFKKDNVKEPKYLLLYAPLEELKRNVIARRKNDARGSFVFDDQFVKRYEAKESKSGSIDPEHPYTKQGVIELLDDKELQKSFRDQELDVEKFCNDLGIKKTGVEYFIHRRDTKDKRDFINTRGESKEKVGEVLLKMIK